MLTDADAVACFVIGQHQLGNLSHEVRITYRAKIYRHQLAPADRHPARPIERHKVLPAELGVGDVIQLGVVRQRLQFQVSLTLVRPALTS